MNALTVVRHGAYSGAEPVPKTGAAVRPWITDGFAITAGKCGLEVRDIDNFVGEMVARASSSSPPTTCQPCVPGKIVAASTVQLPYCATNVAK